MKNQWVMLARTLLVLISSVAFTCCTPAATTDLEWTVANRTDDSLRVTVRYPLDSTLLSADQLAGARQGRTQDSVAYSRLRPLDHLAHHQGRWYDVHCAVFVIHTSLDNDRSSNKVHYARIDPALGMISYVLPPHGTQTLRQESFSGSGSFAVTERAPGMRGLQLQQGATSRTVLPGHPSAEIFHEERTGGEWGNNSRNRRQLTVGPGLCLNPQWYQRWYQSTADAWHKLVN